MTTPYHFPKGDHEVALTTADVYRFDWPGDQFGWAIFTVCDATGEFSIQSDWGNFSYRWHPEHLGSPSLTHFLGARNDHNYVVGKLSYENQALAEIFDEETTLAGIHAEIIRLRRDDLLDKRKARELWDLAIEFCSACDSDGVDAAYHNSDFDYLFTEFEHLYEFLQTTRPIVWTIVEKELLPRFAAHLREHVLPTRRSAA